MVRLVKNTGNTNGMCTGYFKAKQILELGRYQRMQRAQTLSVTLTYQRLVRTSIAG